MYSIYHFFKILENKKSHFLTVKKLQDFPYDQNMLSCRNIGVFPDMSIKINENDEVFTGGELIELKDSKTYAVSSFNSTIPTGRKEISKIIIGEQSNIKKQMEEAGNNIYSLPIRDVFYLVRGRKKDFTKVCLIHGNFFQTIEIEELIRESFRQVLEESVINSEIQISDEIKNKMLSIFCFQENFSKVRNVEKASVKLRFRIMTEVKAEGNILNSNKYPDIKDNTLNFVIPCHNNNVREEIIFKMCKVFGQENLDLFNIFKIKHYFNGYFLVFQVSLVNNISQ